MTHTQGVFSSAFIPSEGETLETGQREPSGDENNSGKECLSNFMTTVAKILSFSPVN